ncbi:pyridoxal phosphate-dependent transferase [Hypoxylon trugodes]|uniref:pyridoxal phosphate-dependent transferase n=1 Tax=Hypoxylon trugodes TaxID=326681 RepID=UPI002192B4AF|nr:pyridoxal phosphate-dependent transferase [Hypoxylon trugodes]KAI1392417.1 pyridoxal phosphate-dependent transferase [Hypoxylon trugodes]
MLSRSPPKLINLMRGWPAPSLLAPNLLTSAAQSVLSNPATFIPALQYGPDPGYQPLREALAQWLGRHFNVKPDPERICISGGASQNIACILQSFTDPEYTRAIWMIAPCYHLAFDIFKDAGFAGRLRAFPEDDEGVDLKALEEGIRKLNEEEEEKDKPPGRTYKDPGKHRKHYRHIIYVVPTCANPSGKTMSLRRRRGLVELARKYDALIICDDVYDFLQWPLDGNLTPPSEWPPEMKLPRLCDVDLAMGQAKDDPHGFGYAVSNGTFSKMVGPGIRTGWVEGSPSFAFGLAQTGSTKSGGSPSQLCAAMMSKLVRSGELEDYLEKFVRPALQRRHKIMVDAIHKYLTPHGLRFHETGLLGTDACGGYFIWLTLEEGISARVVADAALREENLIVASGDIFEVPGNEESFNFDYAIRLTFSWESEEDLLEGVRRLGAVIERVKQDPARYQELARQGRDDNLIDNSK